MAHMVSGLGVAVCMSMRTVGLTLLFGCIAFYFFSPINGRRQKLTRLGATLLIPLIYLGYISTFQSTDGQPDQLGYIEQFSRRYLSPAVLSNPEATLTLFVRFLIKHFHQLLYVLWPTDIYKELPRALFYLISFLSLGVMGLGWTYALFQNKTPAEWFVVFYLTIIFLWPYGAQRFFMPILPLLYGYLAHGVTSIGPKENAGRPIFKPLVTYF